MKNEIIPVKMLPKQKLYEFVKGAFIDGTVPESIDEFEECFTDETTDMSIAFVNEFGENNESVMLFFKPYGCAVPISMRKYLKDSDSLNSISLLNLRYQKLMAECVDDIDYLKALEKNMCDSYEMTSLVAEQEIYMGYLRMESMPSCKSYFQEQQDETRNAFREYTQEFESVINIVRERIKSFDPSHSSTEPGEE